MVITCRGAAHIGGYVCGRIKNRQSIGETLYAANLHSPNLVEITVLPHASTDGFGFYVLCKYV